ASGETVSRVVNDTNIVKDLITDHFPQFVTGIISIIGAVTILLIMDWKMTLIMMLAVPITVAVMIPLGRRMAKLSRDLQDETAVFTGHVQQTLSEVRLMKASNAEQNEEQKGLKGIGKLIGFGLREARIFAVIAPLLSLPFCFIFSKSLCRLPPLPCSLPNYKRQKEQQKELSIY